MHTQANSELLLFSAAKALDPAITSLEYECLGLLPSTLDLSRLDDKTEIRIRCHGVFCPRYNIPTMELSNACVGSTGAKQQGLAITLMATCNSSIGALQEMVEDEIAR